MLSGCQFKTPKFIISWDKLVTISKKHELVENSQSIARPWRRSMAPQHVRPNSKTKLYNSMTLGHFLHDNRVWGLSMGTEHSRSGEAVIPSRFRGHFQVLEPNTLHSKKKNRVTIPAAWNMPPLATFSPWLLCHVDLPPVSSSILPLASPVTWQDMPR